MIGCLLTVFKGLFNPDPPPPADVRLQKIVNRLPSNHLHVHAHPAYSHRLTHENVHAPPTWASLTFSALTTKYLKLNRSSAFFRSAAGLFAPFDISVCSLAASKLHWPLWASAAHNKPTQPSRLPASHKGTMLLQPTARMGGAQRAPLWWRRFFLSHWGYFLQDFV